MANYYNGLVEKEAVKTLVKNLQNSATIEICKMFIYLFHYLLSMRLYLFVWKNALSNLKRNGG